MFLRFRTEGFNGYSLQWSPFIENRLAVATSANYGLVGNGRLYILDTGVGQQGFEVLKIYDTQDGLFDVCWSEVNENHLVTASGDGSIKLWDTALANFPIQNLHEHQREAFSVNWNLVKKDTFLSASWDHTIKLWNPTIPQSLRTWKEHAHCVYNATWSPSSPTIFATASGDHSVKIWDINSPHSVQTLLVHPNEVLSMDWNKYQENIIATGSVDKTVKIWDLRRPDREIVCLRGHEYAIRRVKYSPHSPNIIASASYDMTMRLWDLAAPGDVKMMELHDAHTEFVLGVDFNLYAEGMIATCAWDQYVHVFVPPSLQRR